MAQRNPIKLLQEYRTKKKIARERKLLQREETMKEDLERFLMEVEDRCAWVTYQLNNVNYVRLKKKEQIERINRREKEKDDKAKFESLKENGLSFFKGSIKDYKKWQNSGAKHLEFNGHEGSVSSCKLSRCNGYILSCSEDKTAMLWDLDSMQCLKTYIGHTKIVNDCDLHLNFERYTRNLSILTCSGDGTLRLWNGIDTNAQVIIRGHTQAVYRCSFSPNGKCMVSCSEDKSIRTWLYPEGYLLYVYNGHTSPVTTVRFSPTGSYLISGSDYGERKIIMWNARMPVFNDPQQFPHFIFWTPQGLIRKIVIRQGTPKPSFWLQKNQMSAVTDDRMVEFWPGEMNDPSLEDFPSDSESDSDSGDDDGDDEGSDFGGADMSSKTAGESERSEFGAHGNGDGESGKQKRKKKKKKKTKEPLIDEFIKNDVRKLNGVTLSALNVNSSGDQIEVTEYNPGGSLIVCLQSEELPVAEAFFDVVVKDARFDMFSPKSGQRLGYFHPEGVIPWRPEEEIPALKFGSKKPTRKVPRGYLNSKDEASVIYDESVRLEVESRQSILSTNLEIMWCCPEPEMGAAVILVNVRLRDSTKWQQMSYSLKESAIRVSEKKSEQNSDGNSDNVAADDKGNSVIFDFDQIDRHRKFWEFLRNKEWQAVATFLEKKAVAYNRDEFVRRRFRVLNLLAEMFESADWLIVHTPFIYSGGVTKSVVLCDTEYFDPESETRNEDAYGLRPRSNSTDQDGGGLGEFDDEDGDGDENENGAGLKKDEQEGVGVGEGFGLSTDSADAAEVTATQKSGGGDVAAGDASASGTSSAAAQLDGPTAMDPPPLAEGAPAATGFFSKLSAKLTGGGAGARSSKAPGSAVASGKPPLGKPSNKTGGDGKPLKSNIRRISAPKPSAQAQARVETAAERPQSQQSEASSVDSGGFFKTAGLTEKQPAKTKSVKFAVQPSKTNEPATDADVEESAQQPGQPGQLEKQGNRKVTAAATATASAAARGASKGGVHASTEVRNLPPRSALKKPAGATSTSQHPHHHHHQQPQESQSEKELKKFGDSVGFGGEGAAGTGTGGEDDEDFASEASDNAVMSARPMAADLRLPKFVYTGDVEGKEFKQQALSLAKEEADAAIAMQKESLAVEQEIRYYKLGANTISMWKNLREVPQWLHSDELLHLEQQKAKMLQKVEAADAALRAKRDDVEFTSIRYPEYDMIKSGKFGPDIEEFAMPLPATFPVRAGQAKFALKPVLVQHEKVISKLKVQALPNTLEEVKEVTIKDRAVSTYHRLMRTEERQYRADMEMACEADAIIHLLAERSYYAARRQSHATLPGMQSHYPNPNYPVPALLLPGVRFIRPPKDTKTSAFEMIFGKKVVSSKFALPVGRKPAPAVLQQYNELIVAGELQEVQHMVRVVGADGTNEPEEEVDAAGDADEEEEFLIASKKILPADTLTSDTATVDAIAETAEEGKAAAQPAAKTKKHGSRHRRAAKKRRNAVFLTIGRPPAEVYLGRRGMYPRAPGLEEYIDSLRSETLRAVEAEAVRKKALDRRDTSTAYAKSMRSEQMSRKDESERLVARELVTREFEKAERIRKLELKKGLITRFRVNGFELAHNGSVNDAVFAPSEGRIATAGGDALVKLWDPRDGSFVRSLKGHSNEVFSVRYSGTEQFLVSSGADAEILVWSMLTQTLNRRLLGHVDCIYGLSASEDFSLIVSASHDGTIKTWRTTPRHPDPPGAPRVLAVTDTTALLSWVSPPCFNLDVSAFHIQWRVGARDRWEPPDGLSIPPHFRSKMIKGLIAATGYQFRICAENRLGRSHWSIPSRLTQLEFGLPERFETPKVCQVQQRSIMIGWFAGNPMTFGAASRTFQVQVSGGGKSFEENHLLELSLEEGIARGKVMLHSFKVLYDRYLATKDALIKSQGFSIHHAKANLRDHGTIQTKEGEEEGGDEGDREGDREDQEDQEGRLLPEIADGFSIEDVHHILERRQDTTMLFVVAEYSYLEPGFSYIFRTRGQNVAGFGPWSVPTFSTFTHPTAPSVPHRPHIAEATLRSILFQWEPPETGGSAITGYDIILKNNNRHISLPRSAVTYLWEGLFPGRSYYIKVQARNEVGESGYSEWNLPTQSHTLTGPPEVPPNPRAVAGSWDRITLQTRLSYNNGAVITSMQIEQRFIDPFQIGDWSNPWNHSTRKIPGEVEIVEAVDFEQQQREIEEMVEQLELLKASSGFNPYGNDGHKIDKQIQSMLEKQKPPGSLIQFTVDNLQQNRLYEFRVRFINESGKSEFSQPSHRAKTNKALVPGVCEIPRIMSKGPDFVLLRVEVPPEGGTAIKAFTFEVMDLDENTTREVKHSRNSSDTASYIQCRVAGLTMGGSYLFRCRAGSEVGNGPFSEYTAETKLELVEFDAKDTAAAVVAKVRR